MAELIYAHCALRATTRPAGHGPMAADALWRRAPSRWPLGPGCG